MLNRSLLVAGVLVACTSSSTQNLSTGPTVIRVDQEQPGANCANGGVSINSGADANSDGVLQDSEIENTQYVCNGATVVRCADGGSAFDGSITLRDPADFAQLAGKTCVDGDLIIAGLAGEIPALPELATVTGEVVIAGNSDLTTLDGLSALRTIGQSYLIQGNDSLVDIAALASLDRVLSIFLVGDNALPDLAGLSTLTSLDTKLTISNNRGLTSLHGLEGVLTASTLTIRSNSSLADLTALANLRSATVLEISGNSVLTSLTLANLEKVDVRLLVNGNPHLASVSLPVLATLSDGIVFSGDPAMTTVSMPALLTTGTLTFENDTSLASIDAPSLAYVTADLSFTNLAGLTAPSFPNLTAIGGTLRVYNVTPFTSFAGFGGLESVGSIWINTAGGLLDFEGLSALQTIAGDFTVTGSNQLTSFTGLDAMTEIGGNVLILGNQSLPLSVAQAFVAQVTVHGTVTIN